MLTALRLGNFKAFGPTQRLPIKPITLIFGPNSAGKSSLIHGLALVHEAARGGSLDAFHTAIGGASIDLGGFRQYVHRRDEFARVEVGLEVDVERAGGKLAERFRGARTVSCISQFGLEQREIMKRALGPEGPDGTAAHIELPTGEYMGVGTPRVVATTVLIDGSPVMWLTPAGEGLFKLDKLDDRHPFIAEALEAVVLTATTKTVVSANEMDVVRGVVAEIIPALRFKADGLFPGGSVPGQQASIQGPGYGDILQLYPARSANLREDLADALGFWLPKVLGDLLGSLSGAITRQLDRLSYLGPLRSYPPRHPGFSQETDSNWVAGGGVAWTQVRENAALRERINEWLSSPDRLQTPYSLQVKSYIDGNMVVIRVFMSLREILEEDIATILSRAIEDGEPAMGIALDEFGGPRTIPEDRWEPSAIIAGAIVDKFWEALKWRRLIGPQDLVLIDKTKGDVEVSHRDVGIGVSQVLPVLAAAFGGERRVVAIEQPEIHLHPKLQAELADVFIESALGTRRNTFILETHSEHLILRVLRRIRESARKRKGNSQLPAISPDDVAVLYVQPTPQGSVVHEIPLTKRGEFAAPWPDGFFPDRAKELF